MRNEVIIVATKTVPFNKTGIGTLPDDKPVVYTIQTGGGRNNYTGIAQRGRVQDRLTEHLADGKDPVPGATVQIRQMPSIDDARAREARIIKQSQPPHNKQGK
jgi:hypothetical protein